MVLWHSVLWYCGTVCGWVSWLGSSAVEESEVAGWVTECSVGMIRLLSGWRSVVWVWLGCWCQVNYRRKSSSMQASWRAGELSKSSVSRWVHTTQRVHVERRKRENTNLLTTLLATEFKNEKFWKCDISWKITYHYHACFSGHYPAERRSESCHWSLVGLELLWKRTFENDWHRPRDLPLIHLVH